MYLKKKLQKIKAQKKRVQKIKVLEKMCKRKVNTKDEKLQKNIKKHKLKIQRKDYKGFYKNTKRKHI